MKILEPGKPKEEKWNLQHRCTGWGNNVEGCNALLELELDDLRYYTGQEFPWRISEPAVSFKCPCCGKITDLGRNDWPRSYHKLKEWSSEWQAGDSEAA